MGSKGSKVNDSDLKDGEYETYNDNEGSLAKEKDSKDEKKDEPKVPFLKLFRFATGLDIFLIVIGLIASIGVGVSQPLMFIVFGDMTDTFVDAGKFAMCSPKLPDSYMPEICALTIMTLSADQQAVFTNTSRMEEVANESVFKMIDEMKDHLYFFLGIGFGVWACGWIQATALTIAANRQIHQCRVTFFKKILRQDVGYFDLNSPSELNNRLFGDVKKISNGIGDKLGIANQAFFQFVGGIIIGFIYGWKMALVVLACLPIIAGVGFLFFTATTRFTEAELTAYAKAGDVAEEVLSSIRTVTAFGGQREETERYSENLVEAKKVGIKKNAFGGLAIGVTYFVLFCCYGLAFWYGAKLILDDNYTIGDVLTTFFGVVMGAFGISQLGQNAEYFATAQGAAFKIFEIIDREPEIDSESTEGLKPDKFEGEITFSNVNFTYPARLEQQVLTNVSFTAPAGKTVALCGHSGSGKSTCIQLIQRFYDVCSGSIQIDGRDMKDYNVKWLRSQIGIVSQEPILFDSTIRENIQMGNLDVTQEEIDNALVQANAAEFVSKLPNGIETYAGEGGATLSGGQKQRIAIARALVRNPKILLLDEATSALDTESEKLVQIALERAASGRTTIIVAHRLSTIKNANKICGFSNGKIVEEGNHDSLMKLENGIYFNLCNMQTFEPEGPEAESEKEVLKAEDKTEAGPAEVVKTIKNKDEEQEVKEPEAEDVSIWKIMALNGPEICINITGSFCAFILGAVQPTFAFVFAGVLGIFSRYGCSYDDKLSSFVATIDENDATTNPQLLNGLQKYKESKFCSEDELMDEITFFSCMFIVIGVADLLLHGGTAFLFGLSGENLTMRLRRESFKKYLNLEMAYFDSPFNSTGALTARLAGDASKVQGAIGMRMRSMFSALGAFACAFAISFYYEWRLTLVCFAFVPLMVITMTIMMKVFTGEAADKESLAFEESGKCTTEATMNIRTVAALTREDFFVRRYEEKLQTPLKRALKKAWSFGILYGFTTAIFFFMYGCCFYFAAWLMNTGRLPVDRFEDVFKVFMALAFAAMTVGETGSMAPDFGEAKVAANKIIALLNQESKIDPSSGGGKIPTSCDGTVVFKDVKFHYPTRPDVQVLKGLTLEVKKGETVALVGQSGCGKSTCIQLIQRFYDGASGSIELDGIPVNQLNLTWLREQMGFVQQEPVLFDKTIKENILYGSQQEVTNYKTEGGTLKTSIKEKSKYSHEDVEEACREANAYDFISELPQNFSTECGKKGSHLSGGQKQRVAIARALIRKPSILLLDEATSALDTESERIVQDALNNARKGRTCILIAHRLSTVINADKIAVIDSGTIVEIGNHEELLKKKGAYYSLINTQL